MEKAFRTEFQYWWISNGATGLWDWDKYGVFLCSEFLRAYQEPHRSYHTTDHIVDGFNLFRKHFNHYGVSEKKVFNIAWLGHDLIYNPKSAENEKDSADKVQDILLARTARYTNRVRDIILSTKRHDSANSDDRVESALNDIDMSILGSSADEYSAYSANIRKEFCHVSDEEFNRGRCKFLNSVLSLDKIFITKEMSFLEKDARINIKRELNGKV